MRRASGAARAWETAEKGAKTGAGASLRALTRVAAAPQYLRFKTNLLGAAPPEASALLATLAGALGFAGAGAAGASGGAGSAGAALAAAAAAGRKADGAAQAAAPAPATQSKGGASSDCQRCPSLIF